jgi:hypothetical protein
MGITKIPNPYYHAELVYGKTHYNCFIKGIFLQVCLFNLDLEYTVDFEYSGKPNYDHSENYYFIHEYYHLEDD